MTASPACDVRQCEQAHKFTRSPRPSQQARSGQAGKERDGESGLDNFGVRYFGSTFGRFMSPDDFWKDSSVRDPQSWNKYAYARNNPLRYVDPTGEKATVTTNCTTNDQNQTTCNVQISASIAIYATEGSNLTEQQLHEAASIIESSIEEAWRGSFVQDGVTYNVTTDISVSVAPSQQAAEEIGAQNVIGLSNGPPRQGTGAYVEARGLLRAFTGSGPDRGVWDFNYLTNYAKHEFTHLLGVANKPGAVLSNTDPGSRPDIATAQDLRWGVQEAVASINMARSLAALGCREWQCASLRTVNPRFSSTLTAHAGGPTIGRWRIWWK